MTAPRKALLGAGVVATALLAWVAWGWFRDSALVKVRHVEITGVSNSPDAAAIRNELRDEAMRMTTLHVDSKQLSDAVSGYPIVRSVSASGDFPSKIEIQVHEYRPVALLTAPAGHPVPVAFDGTLLPRVRETKLPAVAVQTVPARNGFESTRVRTLVRVLAGAPEALRAQLERAYLDRERGLVVAMRDGPALEFGTGSRLAAKWASATRVLAAPSSVGADEIDVRLPERPSASGFASVANPQL